ncbi:MAG TPA: hypothetical protein VL328_10195 [Gemmatimonadaceae bacterium]|nr:hypothetical protein [Gemmatimonadaceae bacterium]
MSTLAMLALATALLAGSFVAATSTVRAARAARAAVVAESVGRRALARGVAGWRASDDSLAVGAWSVRAYAESAAVALDSATVRLRVQRVSLARFVVSADVDIPASGALLARRRMRVLLERPPSPDSTVVLPPRPIARWAVAELY